MNKSNSAPIELIAKTLNSERRRVGLSIAEVARRAGVAKSTLSQLENGVGNPSIETLWAICVVLDIPFSRLIEPPRPQTKVVRKGEGASVTAEKSDYRASLLSASAGSTRRDVYWLEVKPGEPRHSDPHNAGVLEHIIITKGSAKVGLVDEPYELREGDYICYPGDKAHIFQALEENTTALLISEYP